MTQTVYGIAEGELLRLLCAYTAIRDPRPRHEFLSLIECWAQDQWHASDRIEAASREYGVKTGG